MASRVNPLDWLASSIADYLGNDISSIRFLLTIFFGYPISIIYHLFIRKHTQRTKHVYFITTGLLLLCWNYGFAVLHLLLGIGSTIAILRMFGPTNLCVALTFALNMTYLLTGYYFMNYGTYDINWTMSYCVLCLKLIGLAWDYRDGSLPENMLSDYQRCAAIFVLPGPIEILSFCFIPTTCFAGPLFTLRHYQSFINQTLRPQIVLKNRTTMQKYLLNPKLHRTLSRLISGILFLILHVYSMTYFPMDYMLTQEFLREKWFFYRIGYMCVYTKFLIMRYLAIWLTGEGACVLLGLGCTGLIRVDYKDKSEVSPSDKPGETGARERFRKAAVLSSSAPGSGFRPASDFNLKEVEEAVRCGKATVTEAQHTQCANISVVRFEFATNTDLLVSSFNINTNKWMLEYVYKRLRFLGNKNVSQVVTLIFLSIWHGFYSGYYINFLLEFVTIWAEKQFLAIVRKSIYSEFLYDTLAGQIVSAVLGKLHIFFVLASPLVAFSMLRASLWIPVFNSVYWIGFVYLLWPLAAPLVKKMFPPKYEDTHNSVNGSAAPSNIPNSN